jgi:phosphatidylcholine synthase
MSNSYSANTSRRAGYVLHVMTASGATAGLIALQAIFDGRWRAALLWLIFCQVLDGLDGTIARKIDVTIHADRIDGHILDLVVDYVTCVVVPIALLARLELLPHKYEILIAGGILLTSALWFARTDQETEDHWFNGFPAAWNIVVPSFLILNANTQEVLISCVLLALVQLTTIKLPHLVRVEKFRAATLPLTVIYLVNLALLSWNYSDQQGSNPNLIQKVILLGFPAYLAVLSIWRTWFSGKSSTLVA